MQKTLISVFGDLIRRAGKKRGEDHFDSNQYVLTLGVQKLSALKLSCLTKTTIKYEKAGSV